jgi:hypothetical protein
MTLFGFRNRMKKIRQKNPTTIDNCRIGGSMEQKDQGKPRKPYQKPTVTKLTPEQSRLKLLGHAVQGHRGAMDLLELMFAKRHPEDEDAA